MKKKDKEKILGHFFVELHRFLESYSEEHGQEYTDRGFDCKMYAFHISSELVKEAANVLFAVMNKDIPFDTRIEKSKEFLSDFIDQLAGDPKKERL